MSPEIAGYISRICIALATISPVLSYPFLPHREGWMGAYMPADTLLQASKNQLGIQGLIIYFSVLNNFDDQIVPRIPVDAWPLYLGVFTFLASQPAVHFSKINNLRPSDFHLAGHWACASLLYFLFRAFDIILGCNPSYAFALAALVTYCVRELLVEHVTEFTLAFMTREMRYPDWLWLARSTEDYVLGRSMFFSVALLFVQIVLLVAAICIPIRNQ